MNDTNIENANTSIEDENANTKIQIIVLNT